MRTSHVLLATVAVVALSGGAALALKHRQFRALAVHDVAAIFSAADAAVGPDQLDARWETLPEPVRRHLQFAITPDARAIRTARLRHDGTFRTAADQRWGPIDGEQYFSVATPGFVWFAALRPMPLFWIQARDAFVAGRGSMLVKMLSAFTIADARGPEFDQGAALRWLAETAWFPFAWVGDAIAWEPIDARSARASLHGDGLPVQAVFEFDGEGRLAALHAERYRDIGGGRSVLTPWSGRYGDYVQTGGFRVPSTVEVTWDLPEEPFSYARFRVQTFEYNATGPF